MSARPKMRPNDPSFRARLQRRYRAERRFRRWGAAAILIGLGALVVILASIVGKGYGAFFQTHIALDIHYDAERIDPDATRDAKVLRRADFQGLVKRALSERFPEVRARRARRELSALASSGAGYSLRDRVLTNLQLIGTTERVWVVADDDVDVAFKSKGEIAGRLSAAQQEWLAALAADGRLSLRFNTTFFTAGDSREPELAGILGAMVGSALTLVVTLALAFPIGIGAATYLEEFAPKNRWTDLIEVNINNLAAVPSIVFGLLGLAVFLNAFELPRSAPLVGGMVLALMTLPTIIIAARAALTSVPPSIREAALAMGASRMQMVVHHVVPLAMPGMLTGTIIGMARALGETAPLLMIGMVAFIVDVPRGLVDPATVLPVQVFLWADSPERAFVERTSAAILVLLVFLVVMNGLAVYLRRRFERRW